MKGLNWKDRRDQVTLLRWAVKNGYGDLWSCYRKTENMARLAG